MQPNPAVLKPGHLSGYAVSLATGAWQQSAFLKLVTARLRVKGLPAAFADDALSRRDIMQCSKQLLRSLRSNRIRCYYLHW
jgi:hypothetical protein